MSSRPAPTPTVAVAKLLRTAKRNLHEAAGIAEGVPFDDEERFLLLHDIAELQDLLSEATRRVASRP